MTGNREGNVLVRRHHGLPGDHPRADDRWRRRHRHAGEGEAEDPAPADQRLLVLVVPFQVGGLGGGGANDSWRWAEAMRKKNVFLLEKTEFDIPGKKPIVEMGVLLSVVLLINFLSASNRFIECAISAVFFGRFKCF